MKSPTFEFEPDAFLRDTGHLSPALTGAWIKVLCKLHFASDRGTMTLPRNEWASILGCHPNEATTLLNTLLSRRICDGKYESDASVTLESRRMVRERDLLLLKRVRQERYRDKKKKETEEEWLKELQEIYAHVNFAFELKKARRWIKDHPGRFFTKLFFLNWLNKIPCPVQVSGHGLALTAAEAWAEVEAHRQGGKVPYTHPSIQATVKAIGGIFADDITITQLDVKRGQFLKMFPDIYAAQTKE